MQTPPKLIHGDKIAIIATARKISQIEIKPAVELLNKWGFETVFGRNLFREYNQFAGTDKERAEDLQWALDDENIKAILIARGGYGTVKIIDTIDFANFVQKPKWIIGYSDVSVLHLHIHKNFSIETLHATMPINFPENGTENKSLASLKKAINEESLTYSFPSQPLNREGETEGILIGGNLSIIYSLAATNSDINTDGKILFIEDLDEYLYHIDRMMTNLKRSGKLANLAGLIVGGMTEMNDNTVPYGKTAEEIVAEAVAEYSYPVCFQFSAGHIAENNALILGRNVKLVVAKHECILDFDKSQDSDKSIKTLFKLSKGIILAISGFFIFIYILLKLINYLLS
jgi:muramoyltetrapeptide carboxypeptidase